MKRIALITGATSGIGKATAEKFAQNNIDLIITGRRNERLVSFAKELIEKYNIKVKALNFDVRDNEQVEKYLNSLEPEWKEIDI